METEERIWEARSVILGRPTMDGKPYDAAVPDHIATKQFALDPDVLAEACVAEREITRFDVELSQQFEGEFAPLPAVLLRTESTSSSMIESITAGAKALALAELGIAKYDSNARLIVANVRAMTTALTITGPLTLPHILGIHSVLMEGQEQADPGHLRSVQVWIGGSDYSPHDAAFIPPHQDHVEPAMEDLCAFMGRFDLPIIARAALAHAQFETIHPFCDGNGRTGRALVHVMLRNSGATTKTTIPVSSGLLSNTTAYFEALTAYRRGDPNPIVQQFSAASFRALKNGHHLAADLARIRQEWNARIQTRGDAAVHRLLGLLITQPSLTSSIVQDRLGISQPTADNALHQLRDLQIVTAKKKRGAGNRIAHVYHAPEIHAALDEFGNRSRRKYT